MSPVKEPKFMAYDPDQEPSQTQFPVRTLEQYAALFTGVTGEIAIGEASPLYWFSPTAAQNIKKHTPNAQLITVLRHPVERFYSHYLMHRLNSGEPRSIEQAIARLPGSDTGALPVPPRLYAQIGYYHQHMQRFWDHFPRHQIGIWLFEELQEKPLALLQSVFQFLKIESAFKPDLGVHHNPSGVPRNRMVHWLLKKRWWTTALRDHLPWQLIGRPYSWLMRMKEDNLEKPPLEPEVRQHLLALYREDTLRLQDAIQRDLSSWLV